MLIFGSTGGYDYDAMLAQMQAMSQTATSTTQSFPTTSEATTIPSDSSNGKMVFSAECLLLF